MFRIVVCALTFSFFTLYKCMEMMFLRCCGWNEPELTTVANQTQSSLDIKITTHHDTPKITTTGSNWTFLFMTRSLWFFCWLILKLLCEWQFFGAQPSWFCGTLSVLLFQIQIHLGEQKRKEQICCSISNEWVFLSPEKDGVVSYSRF